MIVTNVKLSNAAVALPPNWNQSTVNPTSAQQIFSDMIDNTGAKTGISLHITTPFTGKISGDAYANSDNHGLPMLYWRSGWYGQAAALQARGFTAGQAGEIDLSGHANQNRHTRYRINGGAGYVYGAVAGTNPTAPITAPFIADSSGFVTIAMEYMNIQAYLNGLQFRHMPAAPVTITSIENLFSGQIFVLRLSDATFAATHATITDGLVSKVVSLFATSVAGEFMATAPAVVAGEPVLKPGDVAVSVSKGALKSIGKSATYTIKSRHPDNAAQVNFVSLALTDVTSPDTVGVIFNIDPLPVLNDLIFYDPTRFVINERWEIAGLKAGENQFFIRKAADGMCHSLVVVTDDPGNPGGGAVIVGSRYFKGEKIKAIFSKSKKFNAGKF